ncbi:hypothetical protein [Streptomyces sp. NPDC017993]|uniref:hypothetical protein n=1 Tax=Streptomyces sp. NPDC017993 TaxID=3365027 RepID=UPI00379DA1CA
MEDSGHDHLPAASEEASTASGHSPTLTGSGQAAAAFDALYNQHAATLIRQAYLLIGRRRLSQRAVERAFHLAWQRWPEVAKDPDPAGWVRAAAYEYALSPWQRLRPSRPGAEKPARKAPAPPPADPADRALLETVLRLPAPYRRTLLLHDGVGLGLYETAAEVEASTPAAAGRLIRAREAVAEGLPDLGLGAQPPVRQGEILHARLAELAAAQPVAPPAPRTVRIRGERRARLTTRAALGLTGLVAVASVFAAVTAPDGYRKPKESAATASATATAGAGAPERSDHSGPRRTKPDGTDGKGKAAVRGLPPDARLIPEFR